MPEATYTREGPTVDELIERAMRVYPNDPYMAFVLVQQEREQADAESARTGKPRNLNYRDAEHWLASRHLGPIAGPTGELGYATLKGITQSLPRSWGLPFQESTPVDWEQLKAGVKGGFGIR